MVFSEVLRSRSFFPSSSRELPREDLQSLPKNASPKKTLLIVPEGKSLAEYFGLMSDRTGIARYVTADGGKGTVYFNCRAIAPDR